MEILVAEDEVAIREVEVAYLHKAGYKTTEVSNGNNAIDVFKSRGADMAIIDINLPGLNGLEVCRQIRAQSTIPIIIVTAKDSDEDEVKGLEFGADDYIKKPFNPNVLIARVNALLRKQGGSRLIFGDITIDPHTMTVHKDGEQIHLTTTRFNLLLALATHPNTVLSRKQLVEKIYNETTSHLVYERTIDAHIKALRKQLETDPKHPQYIQTVIGTGYRFSVAAA